MAIAMRCPPLVVFPRWRVGLMDVPRWRVGLTAARRVLVSPTRQRGTNPLPSPRRTKGGEVAADARRVGPVFGPRRVNRALGERRLERFPDGGVVQSEEAA